MDQGDSLDHCRWNLKSPTTDFRQAESFVCRLTGWGSWERSSSSPLLQQSEACKGHMEMLRIIKQCTSGFVVNNMYLSLHNTLSRVPRSPCAPPAPKLPHGETTWVASHPRQALGRAQARLGVDWVRVWMGAPVNAHPASRVGSAHLHSQCCCIFLLQRFFYLNFVREYF